MKPVGIQQVLRISIAALTALPLFILSGCFENSAVDLTSGAISAGSSGLPGSDPLLNPSSSPVPSSSVGPLALGVVPFTSFISNAGPGAGQAGGVFDTDAALSTALGGVATATTTYSSIAMGNAYGQVQGQRLVTLTASGGLGVSGVSNLSNYVANYGGGNYNPLKWTILMPGITSPIHPNPTQAQYTTFYNRIGFTSYHHSLNYIIFAGGTTTTLTPLNSLSVIAANSAPLLAPVTQVPNIIPTPNAFAPVVGEVSLALHTHMLTYCNTYGIQVSPGWLVIGRKTNAAVVSTANISHLVFVSPGSWAIGPVMVVNSTTCNALLSQALGVFNGVSSSPLTISGGPTPPPSVLPYVQTPAYTWTVQNTGPTSVLFNGIGFDPGSYYSTASNQPVNACTSNTSLSPGSICQYNGFFYGNTTATGTFGGNFYVHYLQSGSTLTALYPLTAYIAGVPPSPSPSPAPSPASPVLYLLNQNEVQTSIISVGTSAVDNHYSSYLQSYSILPLPSEATVLVNFLNTTTTNITMSDCASDAQTNSPIYVPTAAYNSSNVGLISPRFRVDNAGLGSACTVGTVLTPSSLCTMRIRVGCRPSYTGTAGYQTGDSNPGAQKYTQACNHAITPATQYNDTLKVCYTPAGGSLSSKTRPIRGYISETATGAPFTH